MCDLVENAMDSLLELSVAAEHAAPIPPPVSGFERTAAALLTPQHFEVTPDPDSSKSAERLDSPSSTDVLSEELDLLVDQELELLTSQQDILTEPLHNAGANLSSFPPPPFSQQVLPELLPSSLGPASTSADQPCQKEGAPLCISGASPPLAPLSTMAHEAIEHPQPIVDFSHLISETPADTLKRPLDLAASGRPSAFQLYKKESLNGPEDKTGVMTSNDTMGGARAKLSVTSWNIDSPVFFPRNHGNQGPHSITPVAPSNWLGQPRYPSPWLGQGAVSRAPLKPSATIPKSWTVPAAPQHTARDNRLRLEGRVLVLLRGAPGSGKSTLAR